MDPKEARRMFMRALQLGGQQMVEGDDLPEDTETENEEETQRGLLNG